MKITSNTLESVVEVWDDPGDYPNNVASSPLKSCSYLDRVDGEVHVELSSEEATELQGFLDEKVESDWVDQIEIDLPAGIASARWSVELVNSSPPVAILRVTDFDAESLSDMNDSENY
jgi:hypothetical protein